MRGNSGKGEAKSNNRNPTLKEHERARGKSGEAVTDEKKVGGEPSRKHARDDSHRR